MHSSLALPIGVALAVAMLLISELGYRQSQAALDEASLLARARLNTLNVLRRLSEAESAKRAYMLTNRPDYRLPFSGALREVQDSLRQHRELIRQLPAVELHAAEQRFEAAVLNRISELQTVLELVDSNRQQAGLDLVMSGIGRELMLQVQRDADHLIKLQTNHLDHKVQGMRTALLISRVGIGTTTGLSLALLALYLSQARATAKVRALQAEELRAHRDWLEQQVATRTAELTELTRHLQTAREDEKARLARELHDELGALLTAAKLDVARMRHTLQSTAPELLPRLAHLTELLNHGIALKRRIIEDLRPSTLDNLGLRAALEVLCDDFAQRLGLPIELQCEDLRISPSADLTVYRLVQEALNNAAKYAEARHIDVQIASQGPHVLVEVADDGRGFDAADVRPGAQGLVGMRYRVAAEGGTLQIDSSSGRGTRLTALLPRPAPPDVAAVDVAPLALLVPTAATTAATTAAPLAATAGPPPAVPPAVPPALPPT